MSNRSDPLRRLVSNDHLPSWLEEAKSFFVFLSVPTGVTYEASERMISRRR